MIDGLGEASSDVGVDGAEDGESPLLDGGVLDGAEVAGDVADEALPSSIVEDLAPESARLLEVELGDGGKVGDGGTGELLVLEARVLVLPVGEGLNGRLVVGSGALVVKGALRE